MTRTGILMKKLDQWDLNQDTILIFMSDNGSVGGMVRQGSKLGINKEGKIMKGFNAGMKGAKGSADEGGVRVPLRSLAGKIWGGQRKTFCHIDLAASRILRELANCRKAKSMDEASFPYLRTPRQSGGIAIYLPIKDAGKQVLNQQSESGKVLLSGMSVFAWSKIIFMT